MSSKLLNKYILYILKRVPMNAIIAYYNQLYYWLSMLLKITVFKMWKGYF